MTPGGEQPRTAAGGAADGEGACGRCARRPSRDADGWAPAPKGRSRRGRTPSRPEGVGVTSARSARPDGDEWRADFDRLAGRGEQLDDGAGKWARELDDRLSVSTSTRTWFNSTGSPGATCHATTSASVRPSPRSGRRNGRTPEASSLMGGGNGRPRGGCDRRRAGSGVRASPLGRAWRSHRPAARATPRNRSIAR